MRFVLIAIISIVLFASCKSNSVESSETTTADTAVQSVITDTIVENAPVIEAWQGNLDGKYPVLMWFRRHEDVLMGSLFYTAHNAGAIKLIGTVQGDECKIYEMSPNGNISGIWFLSLQESGAEGSWFSPETQKEYNASLMYTDTLVSIPPVDSTGEDVSGEYFYYYGEDKGQGYMEVVQKGEQVTVSFETVTRGPAYNLASLKEVTLPLNGNEVVYKSKEFGDCAIRIRFFNGFAVVDYVDGKMDCGFGNRATVNGVYIKTKSVRTY